MQPDMSWVGVLEHHAARTPDKPIAVDGDRVVTYRRMVEWAAEVAAGFAARGVGAGDVVGLLSHNRVEMLTTLFAANHLGAACMPINWRLAPEEVRFILEHSEARAFVCDGAVAAGEQQSGRQQEASKIRLHEIEPRVMRLRAPSFVIG